ncbi:MAG TPA: hypothetical protein VFQ41_07095 [Candidatus Angelobacter sp.]|nr:hypothetical protein [Candidatus Angelobacter sp.]
MTYIAAFRAETGVVMCADTLETMGQDARYVEKLVRKDCGGFSVVMGGAGAGDYVDGFIDKLAHDLSASSATGFEELRKEIQKSLRDFYRDEVPLSTLPNKWRSMECLITAQKHGMGGTGLWKTRQSRVFDVDKFDIVGYGTPVNFYLANGLYRPNLPIYQVVSLAAYLSSVAKATGSGVSGKTSIAVISPWEIYFEDKLDIRSLEERIDEFQVVVNKLFLDSMDLSLHSREFEGKLDGYQREFFQLRKKHRKYVAERMARNIKNPSGRKHPYPDIPFGTSLRITTDPDGNVIDFEFNEDADLLDFKIVDDGRGD